MVELLVNIDVDNLELAVTFYRDAFELSVARRFGEDAVELLGAGAPIYLLRKGANTAPYDRAASVRDFRRHWTPVHLDFVVADLEKAAARASSAGAIRESSTLEAPWGKIVHFSDPFGNGFCVIEFSGAGYAAITA